VCKVTAAQDTQPYKAIAVVDSHLKVVLNQAGKAPVVQSTRRRKTIKTRIEDNAVKRQTAV
jgi:hypothetical protein